MEFTQVDKKLKLERSDIIRIQLLFYCSLAGIHLSTHDLFALTLLGVKGPMLLEEFCSEAKTKGIFTSNQSVRNSLVRAEKKQLIVKEGKNRKKVYLNPTLNIQTFGNFILNYKMVHVEMTEVLEPH